MSALPRLLLAAALVALWVAPAPAWAGPAEDAEHTRLSEEMRRLGSRNAWRGVEAAYLKLEELEKKGVKLTFDDHLLGAQAARDQGQITQVYKRLRRAEAIRPADEVKGWIAEILASFGEVRIARDDRWEGDTSIVPAEMPFAPDQRAAIGAAQAVFDATGLYDGLLPFGQYTVGGKAFDVAQGGARVEVLLVPEGVSRRARVPTGRRDGLHLAIGPQFTLAGDPATGADAVQAAGFSGVGLRGGIGYEVQLKKPLGFLAEVGYHGLLAGGGADASVGGADLLSAPAVGEAKNRLNLVYAWGALTLWKDDFGLAVGPSWAGGWAQATGLSCEGGCAPGVAVPAGAASTLPVSGRVLTGGGTAQLTLNLFDMPGMKRTRGGISLAGGAQSDLTRLYPWAQLAFTIAPSI